MRPEVQEEILAAFARPRDVPPPAPAAAELDPASYTDPARFEAERAAVLRRAWIPVAPLDALAEPGAAVTLELGGDPLVVLRDDAGELRVLQNVCRHRGAQLVRSSRAQLRSLRCPYHGFEYGLDGVLRSCPAADSFGPELQPGVAALPQVRVTGFAGWAWACLDAAAPKLEAWMGTALLDELSNWPLDELTTWTSKERDCAFDWKVGVEAFLEPLHVPAIHGRSAHPLVDFRGMALRELGDHSRMALPFRVPAAYAPDGLLGEAAHAAGVPTFARLNRVQREAHFVYLIYPCTILMLFPNHLLFLRFLPSAPGRCQLRWELRTPAGHDDASRAWLASLVPGYEQLVEEDLENLPWIQRGLASESFEAARCGGYEARIPLFRAALDRSLAR